MKLILTWIFLFCMGNAAQAQLLMGLLFVGKDKVNSDIVKMGVQVGGSFSQLSHLGDGAMSPGLLVGFYTDIKLNDRWYLHSGAFPISRMGVKNLTLYALDDPDLNTVLQGAKLRRRLAYLGMPFLLHYQPSSSWRVGLGPQLQVLINAKDEFYQEQDQNELLYKKDILDETHRLDYGLSLHAGYFLRKGEGLYLQLRYYLGLRDVMKVIPDSQANRSIQLIVGIPIKSAEQIEED